MKEHLSREQIAAYRAGSASAVELLRMDDHLSACAECRALLQHSFPSAAGLAFLHQEIASAHLTRAHLTEEQFDAWAAGRLVAAEVLEHLDYCAECRGHAGDLRKFMSASAAPAEETRPGKLLWWAAAAAAVLAAALGIGLWNRRTPAPAAPATPAIVAKAEIPPAFQQQIDAALQSGDLHIPAVITAMPVEQLRLRSGEVKQPVFHVLSPLSTAAIADTPVFRWTAVAGAKFQVFVYDDRFREVLHSEPLDGNEWTASKPLTRGVVYRWEVRATLATEAASAPAPPRSRRHVSVDEPSRRRNHRQCPQRARR